MLMNSVTHFEDSLRQLSEAVHKLESGDLPLEEALQTFEEGIRRSRECHHLLERAEQRIDLILQNENGDYEVQPLAAADSQ
jgi:exodeoxyribonuclease VII small subunit